MVEVYSIISQELCNRIVKNVYNQGLLPKNPSPQDIKSIVAPNLATDFIKDAEWDITCQMVQSWQDADDFKNRQTIDIISARFKHLPTIVKVDAVFGEDVKLTYEKAIQQIENYPQLFSKFQQTGGVWRKFDMITRIRLLNNVIIPNLDKSDAEMRESYIAFNAELRARSKERSIIPESSIAERKLRAKNLGIWFPFKKEYEKWHTNSSTKYKMKRFDDLRTRTWERMKECRNILQFIPRKRLTPRSCADMEKNMIRMEHYLEGYVTTGNCHKINN